MDRRRTNRFFTGGQIFAAAAMSFMHGAQDGQKFIGVLFLGPVSYTHLDVYKRQLPDPYSLR